MEPALLFQAVDAQGLEQRHRVFKGQAAPFVLAKPTHCEPPTHPPTYPPLSLPSTTSHRTKGLGSMARGKLGVSAGDEAEELL